MRRYIFLRSAVITTSLFKFRKFDKGSIELLVNKQLWAATPASLNDPFEGESSYEDVLDAAWDAYPLPQKKRNLYKKKIDKQLTKTGICSFSKTRKNQLMWAHYADEHRGICIGFNERRLKEENTDLYPVDVTYQVAYPYQKIIDRLKYFENVPGENNISSIANDILYSILTTKYSSWKYEKERRLLREESGVINFSPKTVTSIAFGLRMDKRDKETLKILLSGSKWKQMEALKMVSN